MKYKKYIGITIIILAFLFMLPVAFNKLLDEKVAEVVKDKTSKIARQFLISWFMPDTIPIEKLDNLDFIDQGIIERGKMEMKKHSAIITGIARDNVFDLPIMIRHIEYLGAFFADYRVIIFENDSIDGTKEALLDWSRRNSKVKVISENFANVKRPSIGFLATIRNKYLDAAKSSEYKDFDIMMPIDMDMSYGFDVRGIFDSFSKYSRWGAVCSNGIFTKDGKMFDMFAFRSDEFPDGVNDVSSARYWFGIVPEGQKIYDPQSDLLPVLSCFGGMAIYKREFIKGCYYQSHHEDCEHILFNKCIRGNGAKMFMNPAQVIRYSHYR